jgi:hypothetical protein
MYICSCYPHISVIPIIAVNVIHCSLKTCVNAKNGSRNVTRQLTKDIFKCCTSHLSPFNISVSVLNIHYLILFCDNQVAGEGWL